MKLRNTYHSARSVICMDSSHAYEIIEEFGSHVINLEKTDFILRWDSDVMMPTEGSEARATQRSTISAARHQYLTDPKLKSALEAIDTDSLSDDEQSVVREIRREHTIESNVSEDLNSRLSGSSSSAYEAWKQANAENDWNTFGSKLEKQFDLKKEWAKEVDPDSDPYEVLWANRTGYLSQPYIPLETVIEIFDSLRNGLIPLIDEIQSCEKELSTDIFEGAFDTEIQMDVAREAISLLGFDWGRARLDLAPHPFSFGTQFDVRLTTRFDESNAISGLMSVIHEYGHTKYTHGLPKEEYGTPIGEPRGLGVHESQSRFFENHIGRSLGFWEEFLPMMKSHYPKQLVNVSPRQAYEAVNQVYTDNRIRVNADELSYHMHIILRTEIEQSIFADEITVEDVPSVWETKMEEYLGIKPRSVAEGPLQDPHWSQNMPAFIGYTIGSVLAAQIHAAMERDIGPTNNIIREGNIELIHEWLRESIHSHGQRYKTDELIKRATGENLTADYFLSYVEKKYGDLYNISIK